METIFHGVQIIINFFILLTLTNFTTIACCLLLYAYYLYTILTTSQIWSFKEMFLSDVSCLFTNNLLNYRPFTLTEMYYSRVALRHLMHSCLAVKWADSRFYKRQPPQMVLNFFVQWIDNDHIYPDEVVEEKVNIYKSV